MDNLEYIEAYFRDELEPGKKSEFEQRITSDQAFAEETAFYLSSRQLAATDMIEKKERFKKIYNEYKQESPVKNLQPTPLRKFWPWAAAAAAVLAGLIFGWNIWFKAVPPAMLADKYMVENFQTLSVTMGSKEDSLQSALRMYNEGRLEDALKQFEIITLKDTISFEAKKYAGIVSLRLAQYDKAINYFSKIENIQLYANPGNFYHALTLMKRNRPGDKQDAKKLLEQVVQNDLEGKEIARKWLKRW